MSKLYNTKFKPTKAGIVQAAVDFVIKKIPRKKKVSPDIKSTKPTKDIKGSVKRAKSKEYSKRIDQTTASKGKIDTGRKMMREGQKELRRMIDTKKAFKFKHGTTRQKTFPIKPGENVKKEYKGLIEESKPTKKFKTAKQMEKDERRKREKEPFMGGGMAGRRMGYSEGKLVGNQKKIDVAAPFGTINEKDFAKLRARKGRGNEQPPEEPMRDRMKQPLKRKKP